MTDNKLETSSNPGTAAPRKSGGGVAVLALLIALIAAGASGFLGYQWYLEKQAQTAQIDRLDTRLDTRMQQLRSEMTEQRDALLQGLRDQLQAQGNEAQLLKEATQSLKAEERALKSETQSLRDALLAQKDEDQSQRAELQTVKGMLETQRGADEIMKGDIRALQSDIRNLQTDVTTLQGETQSLAGDLKLMQNSVAELRDASQGQQNQLQALETATQGLQAGLADHSGKQQETIARLETRLENLQLAQSGLQNTLEAVKVVASRGGDINALPLSEVEYLLRLADHKLKMQQDVNAAVEALKIGVKRLDAIGEKAFLAVERMIRENIASLHAVQLPDIGGLTQQIAEMERHVDNLSLRVDMQMAQLKDKVAPVSKDEAAGLDSEKPWWDRISKAAWGEVKDIVVIRHERTSGPPLIAVEEEYFLRQNLRLKLEAMRLALLGGDAASYHEANDTARSWIETYFNTDDEQVSQFVSQMEALKSVQLNPYIPDISDTVRAFRDVMDRREPIRSVMSPASADIQTEEAPQ